LLFSAEKVKSCRYALPFLVALGSVSAPAQPQIRDSEDASAAIFPATLDWQRIEGSAKAIETRSGRLTIGPSTEKCRGSAEPIFYTEIRVEDDLLEKLGCTPNGDYYLVFFKNAFELREVHTVILGADAGGSGSPPQRLHLVVLTLSGEAHIEMDPEFRSIDGTERVASDGMRLWFDLGNVGQKRKLAIFDGETLRIEYRDMAPCVSCTE
jgi:hypothetical protein